MTNYLEYGDTRIPILFNDSLPPNVIRLVSGDQVKQIIVKRATDDAPPDEEARRKKERAAQRLFAQAYDEQATRITVQVKRDPQSVNWSDEQQHLTQAVLPFYDETVSAAAQAGLDALPIGVDWEQVNQAVLSLAQAEAQRFAAQAVDTSRTQVSQVIADWIESGGDKADLIDRLGLVWSGPRADVAAVTEVTRLYAQGNAAAWQESGVVSALTWKTANDDLVCPICGPLADTELPLDGELPPAHPNCRCWVSPVVKRPEEL